VGQLLDPHFTNLRSLPPGTFRVISILPFPGHWTMFVIDMTDGFITFVDSLPDAARIRHASKVLVSFAKLCAKVCGWTVRE
jgi:hypothetical protein